MFDTFDSVYQDDNFVFFIPQKPLQYVFWIYYPIIDENRHFDHNHNERTKAKKIIYKKHM